MKNTDAYGIKAHKSIPYREENPGWYPIEFWGRPPCLGWQGIVPRRARIMAERCLRVCCRVYGFRLQAITVIVITV